MTMTEAAGGKCSVVAGTVRAMARPRRYFAPPAPPAGMTAAPLAWEGAERLPVVGPLVRMKSISLDPVGLIRRFASRYGDVFTIRTATTPDFTFLLHDDAYRLVLGLSAEHGAIGPVLDQMPTVGYWFPRSGRGPDSLQKLIVAGRRMMAELKIWDRMGDELTRLYRDIVNGIEITHIALSMTVFQYAMPEYRATRRLHWLLRTELPRCRSADSLLLRAIRELRVDGSPLREPDVRWMFMYVLWNATVYPGAYTFWTLVDVLTRSALVTRLRATPSTAERRDLLARCLLENIRLNPVSSLIRCLNKSLEFTHDGRRYHIPSGQMVGVLPGVSNFDPRRVPGAPDEFDPDRYLRDSVPRAGIFGRGPFGCPAPEFNKTLTATILGEILTGFDVELVSEPPARRCRVPEIHPSEPVPARVLSRQESKCP